MKNLIEKLKNGLLPTIGNLGNVIVLTILCLKTKNLKYSWFIKRGYMRVETILDLFKATYRRWNLKKINTILIVKHKSNNINI